MIIQDCVLDLKRYWAPYGSVAPPVGWADESRYGNDMTDGAGAAAPTWVQLPSGLWVKEFDGGDYGTCGNTASLQNITTQLSGMAWIYPKTGQAGEDCIFGKLNDGGVDRRAWMFVLIAAGNLASYISSDGTHGNSDALVAPAPLVKDMWHFVAFSYTPTYRFLFADGAVVAEDAPTVNSLYINTVDDFIVGDTANFTRMFLGYIGLPRVCIAPMNGDQLNEKYASERHWFDGA